MRTWLMVGFGGFLGSICRYGVTLLPLQHSSGFPFPTLIVNIIGALIIGILTGLANQITGIHADWFYFLQTGFCGGFTTFSTFALEATNLFGNGKGWYGAVYIVLSLLLSVTAVYVGRSIVS